MIKQFSYNASAVDAAAIDIIEGSLSLARQTYEKAKEADYDAKNLVLCNAMAKYAIADTKFFNRISGLPESEQGEAARKLFAESMIRNNQAVRSNFEIVLAQVVNAIIPEVNNDIFAKYIAEIRQVGFGDTAVFQVESNDLFAVKEIAEGVRNSVSQPMYDDEFTVNCHPISIDTHIDWYPFAAGRFDMGYFAVKIARSFAAYIFLKSIRAFDAAVQLYGPAFTINGIDANEWTKLAEQIRAANGGMSVIAIGTRQALSNAVLNGNFQVEIGSEMQKVGYLDQFQGVPLIVIDNVLVPGTTNSTAELAIRSDRIWMIPVGGDRPVKVVFEGNQISVTDEPRETTDVRLGLSVNMRLGIGAILGAKLGTVKL